MPKIEFFSDMGIPSIVTLKLSMNSLFSKYNLPGLLLAMSLTTIVGFVFVRIDEIELLISTAMKMIKIKE